MTTGDLALLLVLCIIALVVTIGLMGWMMDGGER